MLIVVMKTNVLGNSYYDERKFVGGGRDNSNYNNVGSFIQRQGYS